MLEEAAHIAQKEQEAEVTRAQIRSAENDIDQEMVTDWVTDLKTRTQEALDRTKNLQAIRHVLSIVSCAISCDSLRSVMH